jgi:hypothetical protein
LYTEFGDGDVELAGHPLRTMRRQENKVEDTDNRQEYHRHGQERQLDVPVSDIQMQVFSANTMARRPTLEMLYESRMTGLAFCAFFFPIGCFRLSHLSRRRRRFASRDCRLVVDFPNDQTYSGKGIGQGGNRNIKDIGGNRAQVVYFFFQPGRFGVFRLRDIFFNPGDMSARRCLLFFGKLLMGLNFTIHNGPPDGQHVGQAGSVSDRRENVLLSDNHLGTVADV